MQQDGNARIAGSMMSHSMKAIRSMLKTVTTTNLVATACLLLTGCNFAPKYNKPVVPPPETYKELSPEQAAQSSGWKAATPSDDVLRGKWWEAFHDSELNALEEQASVSNQNIAAAAANFLAARAVVKQARSQFYPTVGVTPTVSRSRQFYASTAPGEAPKPFTSNEYSLPFDASWELDLWGRIRNTVKASVLESQATRADLENVMLTVHAEVAADYFQLRVLDAERRLLDAEVLAYEESLKLTKVEFDAQFASGQDVELAEAQLDITRAQATDLGVQRALFEHAIATLIGKPASLFSLPANSLDVTPVAVPPGIPSQLLERRPDIAAAERRVGEANAQIGVARAAYFPTAILGASGASQSSSLGNLLSGSSLIWSVGASMAQTLFDGGKRRAVTEQARAIYQGTAANYRQTVLSAFQDVEDNLSTLRILSQEFREQDAAVASSQRYLTLANVRYKSGLDSYLDVIAAQTALFSNQRSAMNIRSQQMTANIQLIKALGGGWDFSHLTKTPTP
jgi:NodT family efflux transporter outer membrane factor (OMF) lipoprotein